MGTITSGIGLVSGINTTQIIDQLIALEKRPVTQLQNRVTIIAEQQKAYTEVSNSLTSLKEIGWKLQRPSTFGVTTATSSNPGVLSATTTVGAVPGTYQFQVARVVTSQQSVTSGFADSTSAAVGAGSLTIELGGGELTSTTALDSLNGGAGVQRGTFKLTDRSGASGLIDISTAVTLEDVAKQINSSLNVSIRATIKDNRLVLDDLSGGTGNLIATDVGTGKTAANLGIAGSVAAATLTGTSINYLSATTALRTLNDGRGVSTAAAGNDFTVTNSDGSTTDVRIGTTAKTIGDVIKAINDQATAGGGKFHAELTSNGIRLVDDVAGGGNLSVAAVGSSSAAKDLGILKTGSGASLVGDDLLTELGTVSLRSLKGGAGITLGTIGVTNRAGVTTNVNLSGAQSVQDVLDTINDANIGIKATLNDSKNGIKLVDTTGAQGALTIADVSGTGAADLGIAGTFDATVAAVSGANLQRQWVTNNTQLSTYNGGKGVAKGSIRLAVAGGSTTTVDLSGASTIGDVIKAINDKNAGVTASINANGDGLLLTAGNGTGTVTVTDVDASTARDLNIVGTSAAGVINGSFEKTVTVTATDTLTSVAKKINDLGFGLSAQVISDGSATAPFRLALTSRNSGVAGRVTFDAGATGLTAGTLVEAEDAAVFVGSAGASKPLLVTSSQNTVTGVLPGVSLTLNGVSSSPVQLTITRDPSKISDDIGKFSETFNTLVDKIKELGKYDNATGKKGLLLGDAALQQVQLAIYKPIQGVVGNTGNTKYQTFASVGLTIGDGGKLSFDADKFKTAVSADPDAVQKLFTAFDQRVTVTQTNGVEDVTLVPFGTRSYGTTTDVNGVKTKVEQVGRGLGFLIADTITKLVDPVNGVLTKQNDTLTERTEDFNARIKQLNSLIDGKKLRLQKQFAAMEAVLAKLQSQGNSLASLANLPTLNSSN